ncbi:MAG TPA: phospho-N-acetylmuramoyl-pentapeptide-transferase, partial [Usitatibacter sp.]|nr:phospho-N-acetylmuramoyl-pentapeptide-transferase [Usitatibacter sp.]
MLFEVAQWLESYMRAFNVFTYITLRVVLAALTALAISFIVGPAMI